MIAGEPIKEAGPAIPCESHRLFRIAERRRRGDRDEDRERDAKRLSEERLRRRRGSKNSGAAPDSRMEEPFRQHRGERQDACALVLKGDVAGSSRRSSARSRRSSQRRSRSKSCIPARARSPTVDVLLAQRLRCGHHRIQRQGRIQGGRRGQAGECTDQALFDHLRIDRPGEGRDARSARSADARENSSAMHW